MIWDARTAAGHSLTRAMKGSELQDIAAQAAAEVIPGIERGVSKRQRMDAGEPAANWVNRSVRELHQDLPAELAALEVTLEAARTKEATLEARVGNLEARQAELTAREAKRLAVYTRRLKAAQSEVVKAQARLAEKHTELAALETRVAAAEKQHQELEAQRMSAGSLLTGGLRRQENKLLEQAAALTARAATVEQGEQELQLRQRETAAADRRRTREHRQQAEVREVAFEAIATELVVPARLSGQWRPGARYDPDRWEATKRDLPLHVVTAIWWQLHLFARTCLQPIRRLRSQVAALTQERNREREARQRLERRQERALALARKQGDHEIIRVLQPPSPAARPEPARPPDRTADPELASGPPGP